MIDVLERFAETRGRRSLKKKKKEEGRKEGKAYFRRAPTSTRALGRRELISIFSGAATVLK